MTTEDHPKPTETDADPDATPSDRAMGHAGGGRSSDDHEGDWQQTGDVSHEGGRGDPFAAAVRSTRMPMVVTDPRLPDNPIVFCNDAFLRLSGYPRDEVVGRNCRFLQGPDTDRTAVGRVHEAIAAERSIELELLNYRRDGTPFWNALNLGPVRGVDGRVQFFFASQIDVTAHVEAAVRTRRIEREVEERTRELQAALTAKERALAEKTILLDEVDHRVKNNLGMVASLLRLQARRTGDPALGRTLGTMLERIEALTAVHRTLHEGGDVGRFRLGRFLPRLAADVLAAAGREDVTVDAEGVDAGLAVAAARATPLGVLLNELMTNALKHAFRDGRGGRLRLAARRTGDDVVVEVADDGPGFDPEAARGTSLGGSLVERLSAQLGGETRWRSGPDGTVATTRFPAER